MRRLCAVIGFLSVVAIAGSANAAATVDLVWDASGTTTTTLATSSTAVLNLVLTNDVLNVGGSVTVDYSDVSGSATVTNIVNNAGETLLMLNYLPVALDMAIDDGMKIESFAGGAIIGVLGTGLPGGQSYLLGTITFQKTGAAGGDINAVLGPLNSISSGTTGGVLPASQVALGTATINAPEPDTVALSIAAMLALFGVHRMGRRNR